MAKKGQRFKKYSGEFKLCVILEMREHGLGYRETARKYNLGSHVCQGKNLLRDWERIYLTEGADGLMVERRGRNTKGRPQKKPLDQEIENDLIAENQRLKERLQYIEAELAYLKKLDALVRAEEQRNGKKPK